MEDIMTENQLDTPEFLEVPEKKNNKTLWIILAVLAVLVICCCIIFALVLMFVIPADRYQQLRYGFLPLFAFL
jgi:flagellar basal body-associated protein FliL